MGYAERPGGRSLRAQTTMRTPHARKLVSIGLGLIVLGCLWFFFAPATLGGSSNYVVTDGISMEPRFHTGDLVVVRSQSSYHVGEIVAYHSKMFHTVVLHRIIARDGARYVFKGDNNNFIDFEHPAASQLVGALWLHLPGVGGDLHSLRSPALVAMLLVLGTMLLGGAAFTKRRRRRRRQRRAERGTTPNPGKHLLRGSSEHVVGVLAVGLILLLPLVLLALLAFTRPTTARVPFSVPYQQSGTFSYSADAAPGPAYSDNHAVTGDPLFTHLVKTVDLSFDYLFHAAAKHSLTGKAWLDATVASSSGWHTTLSLGGPTYFRGDHARVTGTLDLAALLALMHTVASATAVNGSYTLAVVPHVSTAGSFGQLPVHTTFAPRIQFSLGELEMQAVVPADGSSAGGQPAASPFAPSIAGSATGRHSQPLLLSLKVVQMSVASARRIALGAIALLVLALLATVAFVRPRRRNESAAIMARYGYLIVPVAHVGQLPGAPVIDVADMESLVRIAEHYDRSILHEQTDGGEAFWVTDESGQFRYAVGAPGQAQARDGVHVPVAPDYHMVDAAYAQTAVHSTVETQPEYAQPAADVEFAGEPEYAPPAPEPVFAAEPVYAQVADAGFGAEAPYAHGGASAGNPAGASYTGATTDVAEYAGAAPQGGYAMEAHYAEVGVEVQYSEAGVIAHYGPPSEAPGQARPDRLASEVYADELELGGAISVFDAQAASDAMADGTPRTDDGPGDDVTDAFAEESNGWRAAYAVAQTGPPDLSRD